MPDLDALQEATLTMLRAALPSIGDQLRVFNGGLVDDAGQNVKPPLKAGSSRVEPHWIVYFDADQLIAADLGGQSLYYPTWGFQLTCVGATPRDALWAVQLARDTLNGFAPDVANVGLFQETAKTGPVRIDRGVEPNRFYLPLIYGLTAA